MTVASLLKFIFSLGICRSDRKLDNSLSWTTIEANNTSWASGQDVMDSSMAGHNLENKKGALGWSCLGKLHPEEDSFFFKFLVTPFSMLDLSFLTTVRTCTPGTGVESEPMDHQGSSKRMWPCAALSPGWQRARLSVQQPGWGPVSWTAGRMWLWWESMSRVIYTFHFPDQLFSIS